MSNEEKAKELVGAPIQWTFNYWLDGFSEATQKELREKRKLLLQMADWKDQQFKGYLEQKLKEKMNRYSGGTQFFGFGQIACIEEIINELFPKTEERDNLNNDE